MTVNTTNITSGPYLGNDIADEFSYGFRIEDKTQLIVYETNDAGLETILTVDTDYTVAGIGINAGGLVTRTAGALPTGYEWYIRSDYKETQATAFGSQGGFFPDVHEAAMDKLTFLIQQIDDILGRSIRLSEGYTGGTINALPGPQAAQFIRWKSDLSGFENVILSTASVNLPIVQLSSYDSLSDAISSIGLTEVELWIDVSDTSINDPLISPANISMRFINGNILDGTSTLVINGSILAGNYQIFGDDLTVSGLKYAVPQWFGADNNESSVDDTAAITAAILALESGGHLHFPNGSEYYRISSALTVNKALFITGTGEASEVQQVTTNTTAFSVTSSNVWFDKLKIKGPQNANFLVNENGIHAYGADLNNYISDLKITNCIIDSWGGRGVWVKFVDKYDIKDNIIQNINQSGVSDWSSKNGNIYGNYIYNLTGSPHLSYGIAITKQVALLTTAPVSKDINIENNIMSTFVWEAIDIRGANRVNITGNNIYGGLRAINCGPASNGTTSLYPPTNVNITGNTMDSGVTDGSTEHGIRFAGYATDQATGVISGNNLIGYGAENSSNSGGITISDTNGLEISGNRIDKCSPKGIMIYEDNIGFNITGNTIVDPWTETTVGDNSAIGTQTAAGTLNGYIGGNSFLINDKSATYVLSRGITIEDQDDTYIQIGENYSQSDVYLIDTGDHAQRGTIASILTSGTGEDTLNSTIIRADTVNNQQTITVKAAGNIQNSNGNKTIKFYFGTYVFVIHSAANDTNEWNLSATIQRLSTSSQRITAVSINGTSVTQASGTQGTEDMSADVLMKVTGECADALDTITQKVWDINIK